jgi:dihydrofolate synthase/folylpolyglutamate synthase
MRSHPVLDQLANTGVRLGLERVKAFLDFLGEPHRAAPVVHVAGTNGKGSVCTYVTSALVAAGYRVGTNLSPHLEAVNERFRLDGEPIDDRTLSDAIEALDRARQEWASAANIAEPPLTYFEFTTCLAFQLFAQTPVDVMVIEVGMGGRLDATNVVSPQVCAITTIAFDHTEHLGNTLALIATEKAGILKKGVPVVCGVVPQEARDAIEARAKIVGAPVWRPGADMQKELRKTGWSLKTPGGALADVKLGMDGAHQGNNALVALGVLHQLRKSGFLLPDDAIRSGLGSAKLGGRLERLAPALLVDGAHNEEGANALAAYLATIPRPKNRILVFGMGTERDPVKLVKPLLKHVDEVVTTHCDHPKARDALALAEALEGTATALSAGGPIEDTLPAIYQEADETVVAGSLYLVGAVKTLVREGALVGLTPGQGPAEGAIQED